MKSALINLSVDIQHYFQILEIRCKQRVSTNFWDNPRRCWQLIACRTALSLPCWRCRLGRISRYVNYMYISPSNIHSFQLFHMLFLNQFSANRRFCFEVKILSGLMRKNLHISVNLSPKFLSRFGTRIFCLSEQTNVWK